MFESSKAAKRRYYNGNFITKYFVGDGIDVGAGQDSLEFYKKQFPLLKSVRAWDVQDGDAQYLEGVADESLDFIHASHILEHTEEPEVSLTNWIAVVKPGGYLIITVPDEDQYEHGVWPSRFSHEHKWSFTIHKSKSSMPKSINVIDLIAKFSDDVVCEKIELINDFFQDMPDNVDQTLMPNAECAIEIILRKKTNV
jgi:predicted SAM-dependent methyltransferase